MAGSGKGKKKKNKGKSYNFQKPDNKQHRTSSANLDVGQKQSDNIDGSKEYGNESSPPTCRYNDNILEQLLIEKLELLYKISLEKLLNLGYGMDVAIRAILLNGSVFGSKNVLGNILSNALAMIEKGRVTGDEIDIEPIFEDISELAKYSMQTLINMIVQVQPNMTKTESILCLLHSNSLAVPESSVDPGYSNDHNDLGNVKSTSEIDIGKMLKENTDFLQRLNISTSTPSSSSSKLQVDSTVSEPQIAYPYIMGSESSSDAFELHSLESVKSLTNCLEGINFEDWFRSCPKDSMDEMSLSLVEEVEKHRIKVKERREWAEKIVIQAAKRLNATRMELRDLRLDKNETDRLLKQKEELDSHNSKLSERENDLRNVIHDLGIMNEVKNILEVKKQEIQSEIVAYNLRISESEKSLLEARKNEKKTLKQSKDTEKHTGDLKRLIEEEKQKIAEMEERLQQVYEAQVKAKLRLKQEKEATAEARALLLQEKRLNRQEEENSKSILASLRNELDMKNQRIIDERNRLQLELSQLKAQASSHASSSSSAAAAASGTQNYQLQSSKPCIICRKSDVCILFLPCAHQVICSDCNEEVYDALEDHCPCCKARIEKRVVVYGPSS